LESKKKGQQENQDNELPSLIKNLEKELVETRKNNDKLAEIVARETTERRENNDEVWKEKYQELKRKYDELKANLLFAADSPSQENDKEISEMSKEISNYDAKLEENKKKKVRTW